MLVCIPQHDLNIIIKIKENKDPRDEIPATAAVHISSEKEIINNNGWANTSNGCTGFASTVSQYKYLN